MSYHWDAQRLHGLGCTPLPATGGILEPVLKGAKQKRFVTGSFHIKHPSIRVMASHQLCWGLLDHFPVFILQEGLRPPAINAVCQLPSCLHFHDGIA